MKTAFIVLTYNRSDALLAVLRELAPQLGAGHELLIADDGSRPEQVEAMRAGLPSFRCRVRHVWHPDVGFTAARARNLCAARAEADYLVFMDGDCVPVERFVAQHERLAQRGQYVIGGRVLLSERLTRRVLHGDVALGRLTPSDWMRLRLSGDANKSSHLLDGLGPFSRVRRGFKWKGIRSCNFALWKDDCAAVNGFDESFTGWGHEDADIALRLHNHGTVRNDAVLGAQVFHLWHRENSREGEIANRARVEARLESGMIRAERGMAEAGDAPEAVVTELNG
ncbi:glycosyltransferase family 2 protein [Ramlibacter solisilvae]|uniref:Glycosyl transferase n=1 Tax=Ramlibacter tataouinensis TaxID=94132 RepID=A0A127JYQ7_9BURK|nr:glycosyltransferase [Ramlibacter tataouinensis]AMO25126.1 glycosyl transferase [Ramlibacter tataouinensis]